MYTNYSVLMSVYFKEKPEFLSQSMDSIFNQTIKTDDFVLVCDGPLGKGLDAVIADMQTKFGNVLHVVRLEKNSGLGNALKEGIRHCKNDLVARMDSDDISYPDRCEKQLAIFNTKPEVSICSGIVEEFSESPEIVNAKRVLPEHHQEIVAFAKFRNPFNHPCVMYKKISVESVGSYKDFYLLEDYYLWIRMLLAGYKGYNLQVPILYMRGGIDMYARRGGWLYYKSQKNLFLFMKMKGLLTKEEYIYNCIIRLISCLLPDIVREKAFKIFARN